MNQRLAAGDGDAFAELYDEIADRIYHYLWMETGSSEEAADILQETFVRLYRFRAKLAAVENLPAYAFRIARNELLRWSQSHKRKTVSLDCLFELPALQPSVELETRELVSFVLEQLESAHREVVELKIFAKLTFEEIADVMEVPIGTVATWYRRSMEKLRRDLESRGLG